MKRRSTYRDRTVENSYKMTILNSVASMLINSCRCIPPSEEIDLWWGSEVCYRYFTDFQLHGLDMRNWESKNWIKMSASDSFVFRRCLAHDWHLLYTRSACSENRLAGGVADVRHVAEECGIQCRLSFCDRRAVLPSLVTRRNRYRDSKPLPFTVWIANNLVSFAFRHAIILPFNL